MREQALVLITAQEPQPWAQSSGWLELDIAESAWLGLDIAESAKQTQRRKIGALWSERCGQTLY